jgi:cytochrome c553
MRYLMLSLLACVAVLFATSQPVMAEDKYPVAAPEFVYCTTCHGAQLMGNSVIRAPRLSKMESWYVERQLQAFKDGWRGTHEDDHVGMEMQPMAVPLSQDQIKAAAIFATATNSALPEHTISANASKGRDQYATCAACHGENGEGNQSLGGPALTGINDWYMLEQLRKYRDGSRGSHPQDSFGSQMQAAAQILGSDDAARDVVAYINTLQNQ